MKIATWNLERVTKHGKKTPAILETLKSLKADILVLTETDTCIDLGDEYHVRHTEKDTKDYFRPGERRVSIFSKYPIIKEINTFRSDTSLCVSVETPKGELIIYGTVIGNNGNRNQEFKEDLELQLLDFKKLGTEHNLCVAGDFNISFSDSYYTVKESREKLRQTFNGLKMTIETEMLPNNIDHVVISKSYIGESQVNCDCWNDTEIKIERLSDHKGVWIEIAD
jgi:exonuclease III